MLAPTYDQLLTILGKGSVMTVEHEGLRLTKRVFPAPTPVEPWEYEIDRVTTGHNDTGYYYAPMDSPRVLMTHPSDPSKVGAYRAKDAPRWIAGAESAVFFRLEPTCEDRSWGQWYVLGGERLHEDGSTEWSFSCSLTLAERGDWRYYLEVIVAQVQIVTRQLPHFTVTQLQPGGAYVQPDLVGHALEVTQAMIGKLRGFIDRHQARKAQTPQPKVPSARDFQPQIVVR